MTYARQAASYREMEILSATPGRLLLMLFDHCIQQLYVVKSAIEQDHIERRTVALGKARADIAELLGTLNFEEGGAIATDLAAIYQFLLAELLDVGMRRDPKHVARLAKIVETLREGFEGAVSQVEGLKGATAAASSLARSA